MTITYVRKNDPLERVKIEKQEKGINGFVFYTMISPAHITGLSKRVKEFFALYHDPKEVSQPLSRPHSESSKEEWRLWALHLEKKIEELKQSSTHRNRGYGSGYHTL